MKKKSRLKAMWESIQEIIKEWVGHLIGGFSI